MLEIGKLILYLDAGLTTAQDTIGRFDFLGELPMGHVGMTAFAALADLDQYEAVVKLLVGGTNREPFRAKMLPPLENWVGRKDKLIALSRERFAMPREKIEAKLRRWMNHQPFPEANLPE